MASVVGKPGWQPRPHDALLPRRALSPNEMYAALVAAAGYLPLALSGEDYLKLLPVHGAKSTPTVSASAPHLIREWVRVGEDSFVAR